MLVEKLYSGTAQRPALLTRRQFLGTAAAMGLAGRTGSAYAAGNGLRLRRGGSIHSMLNWPELETGDRNKFVWPPFSGAKYQANTALLKTFRSAGLDFIRLTIDPGPFMAVDDARRDEIEKILLARCRAILDVGMNVVADFHPISQVASWTPVRIVSDPATFKTYNAMIGRIAGVLRAIEPSRIALEFLNEPPYGYDGATAERWAGQLAAMLRSARAANPALTVVASGAMGGGIEGLLKLDARNFRDDNIIWSFHYYSPHHFTHQGVLTSQQNMLHYRYLTELPYPATGANLQITEETIRQALMADRSINPLQRTRLQSAAFAAAREYFNSGFDAASIARDFDRVADWASANTIDRSRILLGEFGAARRNMHGNGALNRDRERWAHDVRTQAERNGFAWALWDIDDNQMGLVTRRGSNLLDSGMVKALGLDGAAG